MYASEKVIIGGDFNMPDVEWHQRLPVENNRNALHAAFYELIQTYGLHLFVELPTRFGASGSNVFDLPFTNDGDLVESISIVPVISDNEFVRSFVCEDLFAIFHDHEKCFFMTAVIIMVQPTNWTRSFRRS